jgi:two-component system, LytTR family, sensor histidine kinase AlgZ
VNQLRPAVYAAAAVAAAAAGISALLLVRDGVDAPIAVISALGPSLLFGLIGIASRYACRSMPLRSTSMSRIVMTHAGAAIVASGVWSLAWNSWTPIVGGPAADPTLIFGIGTVLYSVMVTIHYLLLEVEASRRAEETALRYEVLAREAELKAFKAQVDPHFLFNSLNAVASLCGSRPADAREMAQLMADFFRQTLRLGARDRITLEQEIELVSRYLAIEKVRFHDRLNTQVQVDDAARVWPVPPLLLQPLIENAVRHGVASMVDGGTIAIRATADDEMLRITIENPTDPDRPESTGERIGVQNARGRLAAISGGRATLQTREADGRYLVQIEVPA